MHFDNEIYADYPCPTCGSHVELEPDCPGFGDPVMVCLYCGNAYLYTCTNDDCNWWIRVPNKRDATGMATELPDWIDPKTGYQRKKEHVTTRTPEQEQRGAEELIARWERTRRGLGGPSFDSFLKGIKRKVFHSQRDKKKDIPS